MPSRVPRSLFAELSAAFVGLIGEVDPYTRRHSLRVAVYAERLARHLGLAAVDVGRIRLAGLLHDLGKIGQERSVLLKPGPLDDAERARMEEHPAVGAAVLGRIGALRDVALIVRHHHERPDGRGYPDRLEGDSIPLGSRIVLVADAFDAMTTDRPYRHGMPEEAALAELDRQAGRQFDAALVEAMDELVAAGRLGVLPADAAELELLAAS